MQDRRAELHGWITETERLQRRLASMFAALAALALLVLAWNGRVGAVAVAVVALAAVISSWVTSAHNAAHRQKLDELHSVTVARTRARSSR